jgi:hypothetical protein
MIRTFARRAVLAAVLLATLPAITLAATPGPALASAPPATIHFENQALLQADGSVLVTVDYSCPPDGPSTGSPGYLTVAVVEGSSLEGGGVTSGGASVSPVCDDRKHTVTLDIPGLSGPFQPGDAAASAQVKDGSQIFSASTQAELKVK